MALGEKAGGGAGRRGGGGARGGIGLVPATHSLYFSFVITKGQALNVPWNKLDTLLVSYIETLGPYSASVPTIVFDLHRTLKGIIIIIIID
jgi:hypothetical protein